MNLEALALVVSEKFTEARRCPVLSRCGHCSQLAHEVLSAARECVRTSVPGSRQHLDGTLRAVLGKFTQARLCPVRGADCDHCRRLAGEAVTLAWERIMPSPGGIPALDALLAEAPPWLPEPAFPAVMAPRPGRVPAGPQPATGEPRVFHYTPAGTGRAACATPGDVMTTGWAVTAEREDVTCKRCRNTPAWSGNPVRRAPRTVHYAPDGASVIACASPGTVMARNPRTTAQREDVTCKRCRKTPAWLGVPAAPRRSKVHYAVIEGRSACQPGNATSCGALTTVAADVSCGHCRDKDAWRMASAGMPQAMDGK